MATPAVFTRARKPLRYLREYARTVPGKQQLLIAAYAKALEVIPRQLCDNAGFDSTDILNKLRQKHAQGTLAGQGDSPDSVIHTPLIGHTWAGVDIKNETVNDLMELYVWEPTIVKINYFKSATEAACVILSVDETVRAPQPNNPDARGGPRRR